MKQFGEIIDDVLVLASALNGGIALLKRIQRGLQDFDGFRLGGFRRLRLFQFLGNLLDVRGRRCVRPEAEAQGQQESVYQAHGVTLCRQELTFVLFIVNQRAGAVFGADLFFRQRRRFHGDISFYGRGQRFADFGD